jgi:hypothetical protein
VNIGKIEEDVQVHALQASAAMPEGTSFMANFTTDLKVRVVGRNVQAFIGNKALAGKALFIKFDYSPKAARDYARN